MTKYILIIVLFICADILAQSTPSAYTSNYNFKKWAQGASPSADSLNDNWDDIDTQIKVRADSVTSHRTNINALYDSVTAHRTALGTGSNMDLTTNQTAAGVKTFSGTAKVSGAFRVDGTSSLKADTVNFDIAGTTLSCGTGGTFIVVIPNGVGDVQDLSGGQDGQFLIITNSTTSITTFKDGTGSLLLAGDFDMGQYDVLTLIYNSSAAKWQEISRSNN